MKITLLSLLLVTFVTSSFSQSFKYGVTAGLNASTFPEPFTTKGKKISVRGEKMSASPIVGFHLGIIAEVTIKQISIEPGLFFTTKGGVNIDSYSTPSIYYYNKERLTLNYIQMPINILYHVPLVFGNFFMGGGPYIALGVLGEYKTDNATSSSDLVRKEGVVIFGSNSDKYDFGSSSNVKNPDYGLNAEVGITLHNKLRFSVNYEYGLANLSNSIFTKSRNELLSLSVSFYFP
ncbi:MAG: PorT family protein [Mucilaginibacter sp.]|nr:PorT family protein [Mucilaginibacter sp.]